MPRAPATTHPPHHPQQPHHLHTNSQPPHGHLHRPHADSLHPPHPDSRPPHPRHPPADSQPPHRRHPSSHPRPDRALADLRSLLVATGERARHPRAQARELAPGLHELVALRRGDTLQIPDRDELRRHDLDPAASFARARRGTLGEPLEFGRAGPLPGVHAYILGGPGGPDTAVAALELAVRLALGPAGAVLSVPARGTALFLAPHGRGLHVALTRLGRVRQFWCSEPGAAPLRLSDSLRFLATWTHNAHARLPGPVSPAIYWQRPGHPLAVLVPDAREPFTPPPELLTAPDAPVPRDSLTSRLTAP
jgi:hypothetical protein